MAGSCIDVLGMILEASIWAIRAGYNLLILLVLSGEKTSVSTACNIPSKDDLSIRVTSAPGAILA